MSRLMEAGYVSILQFNREEEGEGRGVSINQRPALGQTQIEIFDNTAQHRHTSQ